jgi:RNA polymerase III subunit RPC82 helix-turn-helix domain
MSQSQLALCSHILSDYYGRIVEKVAVYLAKNGSATVRSDR